MTDPVRPLVVSVVMPVGSVDPELDEQLAALADQEPLRGCAEGVPSADWELVISLNTDDPAQRSRLDEAIDRFTELGGPTAPAVRVVDSSAVRSASHARNVGAAAATAELLAFCDGDDIADKSWLAAIVEALDATPAVGGYLEESLLAVPGQENWRPPATPGGNPSFLGHPFLVSANMGVRADAFAATGGFDEDLLRGEDIAFSWALIRNGIQPGYCADAVMHYRHRKGLRPMLRQHYLYGRGMAQILRRHGTPDGSKPLLKANGQAVEHRSAVHVARRGAIAVGRAVGLVEGVTERMTARFGTKTTMNNDRSGDADSTGKKEQR